MFGIITDPEFTQANTNFTSLLRKGRKEGKDTVIHHEAISLEDLKMLFEHPLVFNTSTPQDLINKTIFETILYFCRRDQENLSQLKVDEFKVDSDHKGQVYVCKLTTEITKKTHQGSINETEGTGGMMFTTGTDTCPVKSFVKNFKKHNNARNRLFLHPKNSYSEQDDIRFKNEPIGPNTMKVFMKNLSKSEKLFREYTNHCIRSTCITLLDYCGFQSRHIKTISVHRYEASLSSYCYDTSALLDSTEATYNRFLLVDSDLHKLFVGQMNNVSIIDLSEGGTTVQTDNIELLPETDKLNYCTLSKPTVPDCQNHIRFITKKTKDKLMLFGSNADSPKGFELNMTDMTQSSSVVPCSNDPFHNFTVLYVQSQNPNDEQLMYYASTLHGESTIQRPIPGSTDYMKGVISEKWMKDPQFVASFDIEDKVYFFFRETAVEVDPAETKIYSRVAKVCKKDVGGNSLLRNKWTSFQKARLTCNEKHVHYDSIQDVVMKDSTFYGLFITNTYCRQGTPASAICAFNLTSIEAAINGPFKDQATDNSYWAEATNVPTPRPGQCTEDSLSLSEEGLQFIADHPLMNNTVEQVNGKPIFLLDDRELQHLELHSNMSEIVFYTASKRLGLYRHRHFCKTYKRIQVINCEQYRWIDTCVKDPHCAWVNSSDYLTDNIEKDDIQCYNRCKSAEAVMQDLEIKKDDVFTHQNYDLSKVTSLTCPPNKPNYMSVIFTSKTSLTFQWTPRSSGDEVYDYQTFVIQYRICKSVKWLSYTFVMTGAKNDPQTASISDLTEGSLYDIRMIANNTIGSSSYTDIIVVSTLSDNIAEAAGQNKDEEYKTGLLAGLVASMVINVIAGSILSYMCLIKKSGNNKVNTCPGLKFNW